MNESLNMHTSRAGLNHITANVVFTVCCSGYHNMDIRTFFSIYQSFRAKAQVKVNVCIQWDIHFPQNTHTPMFQGLAWKWIQRFKSVCWLRITFNFLSYLHVWWQLNTCEVACGGPVCLRWQGVPLANGTTRSVNQEVNHRSVICLHKPTSQDPPN